MTCQLVMTGKIPDLYCSHTVKHSNWTRKETVGIYRIYCANNAIITVDERAKFNTSHKVKPAQINNINYDLALNLS